MSKIKLGARVREQITGFTGIVVARCEYLWGCVQYDVKAEEVNDRGNIIGFWFDEDRLEVIKQEKAAVKGRTGGPQEHPPDRP